MKKTALFLAAVMIIPAVVFAKDLRVIYKDLIQESETVSRNIEKELQALRNDKTKMKSEVTALERQLAALDTEADSLRKESEGYIKAINGNREALGRENSNFTQIEASVEASMQDFFVMAQEYPAYAVPGGHDFFMKGEEPLTKLNFLADSYLDFINYSSSVSLRDMSVTDTDGTLKDVQVLSVGTFADLYRDGGEYGYLARSMEGGLQKVAGVPSKEKGLIEDYFKGDTDDMALDFSGGAVFKQWENKITLASQLKKGGLLIVPIILVAFFAVLLMLERTFSLYFKGLGGLNIVDEIAEKLEKGKADDALNSAEGIKSTPLGRVCMAIIPYRSCTLQARENILNEALLKEVPVIERNLSLLSTCAAVAPMLGLLGTVTGMIGTFHVITLYGSGDPRLMAGGISEALITTMFGLIVAIPVMLAHTFFARRAETLLDRLQEAGMKVFNSAGTEK
jgi:biopolymer transport protein ExbB